MLLPPRSRHTVPDRARMRAQHARTQLCRAILRAELDAAMFITPSRSGPENDWAYLKPAGVALLLWLDGLPLACELLL